MKTQLAVKLFQKERGLTLQNRTEQVFISMGTEAFMERTPPLPVHHVNPGFQRSPDSASAESPKKEPWDTPGHPWRRDSYTDFDSNQIDLPSGQHWCRRFAGCPSRVLEGALVHSDTPGLCVRRQ